MNAVNTNAVRMSSTAGHLKGASQSALPGFALLLDTQRGESASQSAAGTPDQAARQQGKGRALNTSVTRSNDAPGNPASLSITTQGLAPLAGMQPPLPLLAPTLQEDASRASNTIAGASEASAFSAAPNPPPLVTPTASSPSDLPTAGTPLEDAAGSMPSNTIILAGSDSCDISVTSNPGVATPGAATQTASQPPTATPTGAAQGTPWAGITDATRSATTAPPPPAPDEIPVLISDAVPPRSASVDDFEMSLTAGHSADASDDTRVAPLREDKAPAKSTPLPQDSLNTPTANDTATSAPTAGTSASADRGNSHDANDANAPNARQSSPSHPSAPGAAPHHVSTQGFEPNLAQREAQAAGTSTTAGTVSRLTTGAQIALEQIASSTAARTLQTVLHSDLQFGVQTEAFGRVTIQTANTAGRFTAEIALENASQASSVAAHLPVAEQRIAAHLGVQAAVSVAPRASSEPSSEPSPGTSSGSASGTGGGSQQESANQRPPAPPPGRTGVRDSSSTSVQQPSAPTASAPRSAMSPAAGRLDLVI